MECKKCGAPSTITLRKKDKYCSLCFILGANHKFRATIGKNKILSKNDKVLICISGGPSSTVLLDLVHYGITLDIHKKLRIEPYFLHVTGTDKEDDDTIIAQCEKYNVAVYIVHISEYLNSNKKLPDLNRISRIDSRCEDFRNIVKSLPSTAYDDFINKVKQRMFIEYAKLLDCNYIFTAENSSRLAKNLLTNLALGRGSQVQNDIGFIDNRYGDVKIVRPLKDLSQEECDFYIQIKKLIPKATSASNTKSLQTVIDAFVTELQDNFQSTISTVCKTADKIGVDDAQNKRKCSLCESSIIKKPNNLTAMEATNISSSISSGIPLVGDSPNKALFPFFEKHFCYSCSKLYADINPTFCLPNVNIRVD